MKKTSRASREEFQQRTPSRRSHNRDRDTNRNSSTELENQVRDIQLKLKNVI